MHKTTEKQIKAVMAELGRRGGLAAAGAGARVVNSTMTDEQRRERARKGGIASGRARAARKEQK